MATPSGSALYSPAGIAATTATPAAQTPHHTAVRIRACTWNVGNKPPPASLAPWIPPGGEGCDIIVVGVQECKYKEGKAGGVASPDAVNLSMRAASNGTVDPDGALVGDASDDDDDDIAPTTSATGEQIGGSSGTPSVRNTGEHEPIFVAVRAHLGPHWREVRSVLMWQTGLAVYAKVDIAARISHVEAGYEATGILGVGKNKGGLAVGLRFCGTSLLFVASHLAAHMQFDEARNANVAEILENLRLEPRPNIDMDAQYHHAFWAGDLNYRADLAIVDGGSSAPRGVDDEAKRAATRVLLAEGKALTRLLPADQLHDAQRAGKVFVGWKEAPITFLPTFTMKREPGFVYAAKRASSWCDRVLWKSLPGLDPGDVTCEAYEAHPSLATSDHKPVSASLTVALQPSRALHPSEAAAALSLAQMPRLQLLDLAGADMLSMDLSGKSDVYCLFYSDPDWALCSPDSVAMVTNIMGLRVPSSGARAAAPGTKTDGGGGGSAAAAAGAAKGGGVALSAPKTRVKNQTLHPRWDAADLPELRLRACTPAELARAHLIVVTMDYDLTDADDRMGQVLLPLGPAAAAGGAPVSFSLPVVKAGIAHGTLSGKAQIIWPDAPGGIVASGPSRHAAHAAVGCRCSLQ